jgi:hypothetical protein
VIVRAPADPALLLRDIHQPPAPPWWPPAPGWWILAVALLLAIAVAAWFGWRRARRRRLLARLFDQALAGASTPAARVAVMSELLRRAGRHREPRADTLRGEAWIEFLDAGHRQPLFSGESGRLLLDGGFRRDVDASAAAALAPRARQRFLEWMAVR